MPTMNFKRRLPIPQEIREEMPLVPELADAKRQFDADVAAVITGASSKKLLIIGPCSADREDSVLEYVTRLAKVRDEVSEKLIIIPRVYTNKPRTKGTGYKGLLHQPNPEGGTDLLAGIKAIRHMHLRVIEETGMFTADEMLYPDSYRFLFDLLAYVAIGARSVENQDHRQVASGVEVPVGMKNPTGGSTAVMLNAIYAAQQSQDFIYRNWDVTSTGNPLAHAVLRGYRGLDNIMYPNYHYEYLERLADVYLNGEYENPAVIIDCNHDNSGKRPFEQPRICKDVLESCRRNSSIAKIIRGFMVESYLEDGNQPVDGGVYGKSITDACIGWNKTVRLIYDLAERL